MSALNFIKLINNYARNYWRGSDWWDCVVFAVFSAGFIS